jgi:hypothetical protein
MDVELYVYDLSQGLARMMSQGLLGIQIDAVCIHFSWLDVSRLPTDLVHRSTIPPWSLEASSTSMALACRLATLVLLTTDNPWRSSS